MATRDDFWRFAGLILDGHPGPEPTGTPGESRDLRCLFSPASDSSGGAWPGHFERYQTLLEYMSRAGEFVLHDVESGAVGYTETHEGGAIPNGSLVVGLRPPTGSFGRGGWWLIESVEDRTTLKDWCDVRVSVVFLAPIGPEPGAYETRFALARDLEAPTLI